MATFSKAYAFTLGNERGFTVDQGGPTLNGVTQDDYDEYRTKAGAAKRDVRQMTEVEQQAIYLWWWNPLFSQISDEKLATKLYDECFNTSAYVGKSTAVILLQRALQFLSPRLSVDGNFRQATLDAVNVAGADVQRLYDEFIARICEHYVQIIVANPKDAVYALGWMRRAARTPA